MSAREQPSEWRRALRVILSQPLIVTGCALVLLFLLVALLAPVISPYGVQERNWSARLSPPSRDHWFGTDDVGGDIFTKVLYGARTTIHVASVVVGSALIIGTLVGLVAAYWGGVVDTVTMRVADVFLCLPALVLALAIIVMLGPGLQTVMLALVVVRWPQYARIARSKALVVREQDFVQAAVGIGSSSSRCIFRHVLPNMVAPVLVYATMDMGAVILLAAGLSFLGLGAGPGSAEWGRMVSDARGYLFQQPWLVLFPGAAILFSVLGFNLVGDGLRDLLDPRMRHGA